MTNTTNATPVTDRVFAAMRADVMYCPTVGDMAAVIRERGSVLPDAGAVWAVWHREDDGSLVLCEFDGCVCYTAHRTHEAAVKAAAETNDCYRCEKYVAAIVPAGIACCLGDDMADTMRAGGGDFEWSAFMEGGFICLRVPAPNMSIAPAPAPAMVPQPAQQQQAHDMRDCGQVPSTITLPTHWAGFLINGDATGLDDGEEDRIAAHLKAELPDDAAVADVVEGSERFTWSYRLYGGDASGGDVADYTVLRPGARAAVQRAGATA